MASQIWQKRCTKTLTDCVALGAAAGETAWERHRRELVQEDRIIIANCDLRGRDLAGFNFSFCYFIDVDLTGASLRRATFDRAIVRKCFFVRADLRGADFSRASIGRDTIGWDAIIDRTSRLAFTGASDDLGGFGPLFRSRAEDDQRVDAIERSNRHPVAKIWYRFIDYGRSIWRLGIAFLLVTVVFGVIYWLVDLYRPDLYDRGHWAFPDFIIMSTQRFLNGPPFFGGQGRLLQSLFALEGVLGYASLGLLAAVLVRKLVVVR